MRFSDSHPRIVRRPGAREVAPRTDRLALRAGALLTALLGAVAPGAARARLSDHLTTLRGSLAEHSEAGAEQSVGEMMASLDAMRRAIDDVAPNDRATLALAMKRAREL